MNDMTQDTPAEDATDAFWLYNVQVVIGSRVSSLLVWAESADAAKRSAARALMEPGDEDCRIVVRVLDEATMIALHGQLSSWMAAHGYAPGTSPLEAGRD